MAAKKVAKKAAKVVAKRECAATMESLAVIGHTHTCVSWHDAGDHFCAVCRRYWWSKQK